MKIKESKSSFENLINKYTKAKAELYTIEKNIREAEKKAESDYVQNLRTRKENIDRQIDSIGEEIGKKQSEIETLKDQVIAHKKQRKFSQKNNVSDQIVRLITRLHALFTQYKNFLFVLRKKRKRLLQRNWKQNFNLICIKPILLRK